MAADRSAVGGLDQKQFLWLLLAGLQNQDPLSPMDNQDFLGQLAQFANLQGMQSLNANFSEMLKLQEMSQGAGLIGKTVQYASGTAVASGKVSGLAVNDGQVFLQVGSAQVALDDVKSVGS